MKACSRPAEGLTQSFIAYRKKLCICCVTTLLGTSILCTIFSSDFMSITHPWPFSFLWLHVECKLCWLARERIHEFGNVLCQMEIFFSSHNGYIKWLLLGLVMDQKLAGVYTRSSKWYIINCSRWSLCQCFMEAVLTGLEQFTLPDGKFL
jgi:hypothetical protein